MQNLYYDKSLSNEQRSYLCFALAKSFEDMNNFSSAFRYYTEGNKLKEKLLNYNINQDKDYFNKIKDYAPSFKKKFFKKFESIQHTQSYFHNRYA